MEPLQFLVPVEDLVAVEGLLPYAALALVLVNMVTRLLGHRTYVSQAESGGVAAVSRYVPHTVTSVSLLLVSFAYMIVAPHGGMVLSVLVVGTLLADFFEFESRKVEARNDMPIERPKSALTGSLLVMLYAGYQSIFFVIQPFWNAVV
ncbi:MAG: hypothetical protein A07HB70_00068 [uncultured archaeon A07HB70]|jgi:hypothetical protein|nr:MAG: hypothetical protein A07HB70_00068 [uncultured archaeon A07HB70]